MSDVGKNLKDDLPPETESGLAVDGSIGLKSLNNVHKPYGSKDSYTQLRSFPCRKCDGMVFASRSLRNWHNVQTHREHQCQKCGMVFTGRCNFAQHVHVEHPGLPVYKAQKLYVCEYCSRSFVCSSLLRDHISTVHLGTVQHRCDQCGKVLVSASSLRLHRRQVHELDYKRTCDGCGRQFSRTTALLDHMTNAHPHLLPDKYRGRADKLACKQCALKFTTHGSLKRHVEVRHSDAPRHRCPVCSRAFRCHRYVVRHVRLHHPAITDAAAAADSRAVLVDAVNEDSAVTVK